MNKKNCEFAKIPALLHDARLLSLTWNPEQKQVSLVFECLRKNIDGSDLKDPRVEIRLINTTRIAAYYDPASIEARPSTLKLNTPITESTLSNWTEPPAEALLSINSTKDLFHMETSARIDWLLGQSTTENTSYSICLQLDADNYDDDAIERSLFFECDRIEFLASGEALDIDEWEKQSQAWWQNWDDHWETEEDDYDDDMPLSQEDALIPAGEDPPPDTNYRPPNQPAYDLTTDAPAELMKTIQDWHEALLARDWMRLATAWPDFDKTQQERAEELQEHYLETELGCWTYARKVDKWWQENRQACVAVRGIEHVMPDEEDPALNRETVITYALRKHETGWGIISNSQGWPEYDSAPKDTGEKPWLKGWDLSGEDV